jgi:hypothetical protein
MADPLRPRTYPHLYAFFRERTETRPDSNPLGRRQMAELFHRSERYGYEAWYWDSVHDELRQIRCYGTHCGFSIRHPETLYHGGYEWIAPLNAVAFANTGGDGCHFSFVVLPGCRRIEECPVVMIVPCGEVRETANVIVGENLWEFLALGLRTGFDVLDMLPCRPDEFLAEYPDRDPVPTAGDTERTTELHALAEQFGLTGWDRAAVRPRLAELRARYFPHLVFGPDITA